MQAAGLALYNPLTDNWGELILVAGHPPPSWSERRARRGTASAPTTCRTSASAWCAGAHFTAADNETTEPVAVVNEAFVKRFFKSGEDPLDQHFGLDLPENVSTFRIVGVVRDAKFAGFALEQPTRPMFFVPLAQNVNYRNDLMKRIELQSHFIGGMMLVTDRRPARSSRC